METCRLGASRELFEETGQILGTSGQWKGEIPQDWKGFAAAGYRPDASGLKFVFRAITPPGRPRRFVSSITKFKFITIIYEN